MEAALDHYLVELYNIYEDGLNVSSVGLLGQIENVLEGEDLSALYNPDRYRKTNGILLSIPKAMSNVWVGTKNPGFPVPRRYYDSDMVANSAHVARARGILLKEMYCPSTYTPEFVTMKDSFSPKFCKGMNLHFFWNATKETGSLVDSEKLYGQTDKNGSLKVKHTFKINARNVVCADDGETIFMNDGVCLVEKIMQTEADIITKSGIYMQSELRAIGETGIIRHSHSLPIGDKVRFVPNADYEMEILGKKYYAMQEECILATVDMEGNVHPNSDRTLILADKEDEATHNGTIIPENARSTPPRGTILAVGPKCELVSKDDRVMFGNMCLCFELDGRYVFVVEEKDIFAALN